MMYSMGCGYPRMSHAPMPVMMYGCVDSPSMLLLLLPPPSMCGPDPASSEDCAAFLKGRRCESVPRPCGNLPWFQDIGFRGEGGSGQVRSGQGASTLTVWGTC